MRVSNGTPSLSMESFFYTVYSVQPNTQHAMPQNFLFAYDVPYLNTVVGLEQAILVRFIFFFTCE